MYVHFPELAFEQCATCGTVYKTREAPDARPPGFYEADYQRRKRGRRWNHRVRKAMRQVRAARELIDAHSLLDVGCSVGYIVEAARQLGMQAAGTDVSKFAVDQATQRGLLARVGDLENLPFEAREFDLVFMRHVLEHTPTPQRALAEVKRVLKAGGGVVIAVPDLDYWKGDSQRNTYRYFRPDDLGRQHFVYYTEDSLRRVLEANGFTVLTTSKAFGFPRRARGSGLGRIAERLRLGALRWFQSCARMLRMRRELYFIARLSDGELREQ